MGLGLLLRYTAVACEGAGALYPTVFYYGRSISYFMCSIIRTGRYLRYSNNPKSMRFLPRVRGHSRKLLRLAAWAAVKRVVDEDITFRAKVVFAILTPIAIERTHSFADIRCRSSPERQRARVTMGARLVV